MLTIDPTDVPLLPNTLAPVANILVTAIPVAVVLPVELQQNIGMFDQWKQLYYQK